MKVNLVCESFNPKKGQGIYKAAYNLRKALQNKVNLISEKPEIAHSLNPLFAYKNFDFITIHDLIPYVAEDGSFLGRLKRKMILNEVLKTDSHFIVPSQLTEIDLTGMGISQDRITEINWGVDMQFFKPMRKPRNERLKIGYVGALTKRKNLKYMISMAKVFPEFDFMIAGKGQEESRLKELKRKLKLRNLKFIGFIKENELPEFYNSLNAFMLPSCYEGFGMQLLEAMSCEVPFIFSIETGVAWQLPIYVEKNTFIHGVGDDYYDFKTSAETFPQYLRRLLDGQLKPLKNQRKWLTRNHFTWEDCARKHVEVYEEILNADS